MATGIELAPDVVEYPSSDGKPMAESDLHRDQMAQAIDAVRTWFADRPDVYVTGNLLVYFEQGNPRRCRAPDLMVVVGVPKGDREVYKVWEEGRFPDFVLEITSKSTRGEDTDEKFRVYRDEWKVKEYVLFDPRQEYLKPSFQGHRLVDGEFQPIPIVRGQLRSEVLGLKFERAGVRLVIRDVETGRELLTAGQDAARRAREERELAESRAAVLQAELEEAIEVRLATSARAAAAEAENARLRAELDALRNRPPA